MTSAMFEGTKDPRVISSSYAETDLGFAFTRGEHPEFARWGLLSHSAKFTCVPQAEALVAKPGRASANHVPSVPAIRTARDSSKRREEGIIRRLRRFEDRDEDGDEDW